MTLPDEEDPSWKDFKIVVDKFLGDVVRRRFCRAIQQNENGIAAMDISGIMPMSSTINVLDLDEKKALPKVKSNGGNKDLRPLLEPEQDFNHRQNKSKQNWWPKQDNYEAKSSDKKRREKKPQENKAKK